MIDNDEFLKLLDEVEKLKEEIKRLNVNHNGNYEECKECHKLNILYYYIDLDQTARCIHLTKDNVISVGVP